MTPAKAYRLQNGKEADSNLKAKWEAEAKKKRELEGRTGGGGGNKMAERVLLRVSQKLEGKREFLDSHHAAPGFIPRIPKFSSEENLLMLLARGKWAVA